MKNITIYVNKDYQGDKMHGKGMMNKDYQDDENAMKTLEKKSIGADNPVVKGWPEKLTEQNYSGSE